MLSNLLKTLKSQKSSKGVIHQKQVHVPKQESLQHQAISEYKIDNSLIQDQNKQIKNKIKRIRYYVLPELPNIFNQVLACPISVFHFLPHGNRKVKEIDLKIDKFPHYLQFLEPFLQKQLPTYNHLLINDYMAGIGIMPHSDGPSYLGKVFVLSLNSYAIINFQKSYNSSEQKASYGSRILLQPNSIHIFEGQAYTEYLHGIQNYLIDSILVNFDQSVNRVVASNIDNYQLLAYKDTIEGQIRKGQKETELGQIRIIQLQGNSEYTHKIEITRKQRISITIRQKYHL